ncbi:hypothetical protein CAPN002_07410 [Capnocytophaga stomatis]|uniref:hypothetical protein n=1 Tax=Capnocytophaga stomatis TaxID=1848904 RepID=UPI001A40DE16|nr:hypothetical protein [Capnocytophaga stomatis]GIJ93523.1 hypothetical protein CAPN002_07410 [Capnocytophaga stomatis]
MIKERVIQVIEIKGIAKEKFFEKIGVTSANFRGNAKKTPLNSTTIENILSEIPELNPEWLLTGKGSMLKTESNPTAPPPEDTGQIALLQQENAFLKEKIHLLEENKALLLKQIQNLEKDKNK